MSIVTLCVYCEQLPERGPSSAARLMKCPLCHTELGVTSGGTKFRLIHGPIPSAVGPHPLRWLVFAVFVTGCLLAGGALYFSMQHASEVEPTSGPENTEPAPTNDEVTPEAMPTSSLPAAPVGEVKPYANRAVRAPLKGSPYVVTKVAAELPIGGGFRQASFSRRNPSASAVVQALGDRELSTVPEVALPPKEKLNQEDAKKRIADLTKKIRKENRAAKDGYLHTLMNERADLAGLPFLLGDDCRTKNAAPLALASRTLRELLEPRRGDPHPDDVKFAASRFWKYWDGNSSYRQRLADPVRDAAVVAGLMQILGPGHQEQRVDLIGTLEKIDNVHAAKALARLALFDSDEYVRTKAIEALRRFEKHDFIPDLALAFRHPWPAVAEHAADVLVQLGIQAAVPSLINFLDQPDPSQPFEKWMQGKKVAVVREMIKINHHRNCQLCHAPADSGPDREVVGLFARIPSPAEELPPMSSRIYYSLKPGDQDHIVRADITYLRQDFSRMEKVADAAPWPEMQRFDYLVRTRTLTAEEAAAHAKRPADKSLSAQHQYALAALRELTGQDYGPTAEAWRRAGLPYVKSSSK